jgi:hypothetical protein
MFQNVKTDIRHPKSSRPLLANEFDGRREIIQQRAQGAARARGTRRNPAGPADPAEARFPVIPGLTGADGPATICRAASKKVLFTGLWYFFFKIHVLPLLNLPVLAGLFTEQRDYLWKVPALAMIT